MSGWITHREAAEILGVHVSLIPKMLRRGDLTSRQERRSLRRSDVEALKVLRAQPRLAPEPKSPWVAQPPSWEHDWLNSDEAAELLGLGRSGVSYRVQRGKLPNELHDGRRWFRRDHIELVKHADQARRDGRP